jgi:hypothetical protein
VSAIKCLLEPSWAQPGGSRSWLAGPAFVATPTLTPPVALEPLFAKDGDKPRCFSAQDDPRHDNHYLANNTWKELGKRNRIAARLNTTQS